MNLWPKPTGNVKDKMRRTSAKFIVALGVAVGLAHTAPAMAKSDPEIARINSFSGAFLAAKVAEVDNDLDSAVAYYERALQFDPDNDSLSQSVLLALISKGSFDEALPYAKRLQKVAEIERFSRVALAVDAFRNKDYPGAETWLKLALGSDLDDLITGLMTGWAKVGENDIPGALAHVDDLAGPEWYDLFLAYHKALIAERAGDREKTISAYDEVIKNTAAAGAAPETYLRAVEAYGGYLARIGKKDDALKVLDGTEKIFPGRVQIAALRDKINAGEKIKPLVSTPSDGASEVLLNLGAALNRGGGESFVRLYIQLALALRPDSDAALLLLGSVAEQMNKPQEAIDYYARIPSDSAVKRIAELQLGLNLADLDRPEEAVSHLDDVLKADPGDMRAYLALGGVYASDKEYAKAADIYDRAVANIDDPTRADWNVYYQRGIAYERLKEWPKAEPNFQKALELYPDQPQVLNYLGYSWVDMNMNLEEGLDMIRKAVDLRPSDGYIVDSLGWAYYRLGRYKKAATELERAVSLRPDDPILNDHLGDAYWRVGRKLEATFQWSHARDMKPDPDVLTQVEKKLQYGLPPANDQKLADEPAHDPKDKSQLPASDDDTRG